MHSLLFQFRRRLSGRTDFTDGDVQSVLEVVSLAAVPLHFTTDLPGMSGVSESKVRAILENLTKLFPLHTDGRVHVFHKSIVEWLTGSGAFDRTYEKDSGFYVDAISAHRRIAAACATALIPLSTTQSTRAPCPLWR